MIIHENGIFLLRNQGFSYLLRVGKYGQLEHLHFGAPVELAAAAAFADGNGNCARPDILRALNRMSSMIYILMIREKGGR